MTENKISGSEQSSEKNSSVDSGSGEKISLDSIEDKEINGASGGSGSGREVINRNGGPVAKRGRRR